VRRLALLCLLLLAPASAGGVQGATAADRRVISARIREGLHPWLRESHFPRQQKGMHWLYAPRAYAALWLDGARLGAQAAPAIAALTDARSKGLDPLDYDAPMLDAMRRSLDARVPASAQELALFDTALSVATLRFLSDLHLGRVVPPDADFGRDIEPERHEVADLLADAAREGRVAEAVAEAEPDFQAYKRMLNALHRYQALASDPSVAPVALEPTLEPGDDFAEAGALARWLGALGDLPPGVVPAEARYDEVLAGGVARFQRRHGLEPDGVLGPATARALAVPPVARVRQIELALERFRWLPDVAEQRLVLVNVPAFELTAYDRMDPPDGPALSMRVVAGRAGRTPTPVLAAALKTVVFGPYWNVPRSIVANEILPKLERDIGYLAAEQMEIVADGNVLAETAESVARLAAGGARLRQRPGPKNALGRVKFLLPNPHDVYLHDTPSQALFRKARRDFSHGCVRIEQPEAFARWVLGDQPEWGPERIEAALAEPKETRVAVRSPILVLLLYATAQARSDGSVSFYEDLYGHDAELERKLARGPPSAP
jgi:murein L,D-transpeptidase YcbB/YkuD